MKQQGITLLEQLCVISIIALIIVVALQRYLNYQQLTQIATIEADLNSLFTALNDYFDRQGCRTTGVFNGSFQPDIIKDLKLIELAAGRAPLIRHYTVTIQQFAVAHATQKPLYQFIIHAEPAALSTQKIRWLRIQTNGYNTQPASGLLQWRMLPNQPPTNIMLTWVLTNHLQHFKKNLLQDHTNDTYSNCAQ